MSNIITSFSVPADSKAASTLLKWKKAGVNVSNKIQDILDEDTTPLEKQVEAKNIKLWWIAFQLYYPRHTFAKRMDESGVTDLMGFRYTKAAVKKKAIEMGW